MEYFGDKEKNMRKYDDEEVDQLIANIRHNMDNENYMIAINTLNKNLHFLKNDLPD